MFNAQFLGAARAAAIVAAATLVVGALPAGAANADRQATDKSVSETRKYCVVETVVGSRLPLKTCKTRADWIKETGWDPTAAK